MAPKNPPPRKARTLALAMSRIQVEEACPFDGPTTQQAGSWAQSDRDGCSPPPLPSPPQSKPPPQTVLRRGPTGELVACSLRKSPPRSVRAALKETSVVSGGQLDVVPLEVEEEHDEMMAGDLDRRRPPEARLREGRHTRRVVPGTTDSSVNAGCLYDACKSSTKTVRFMQDPSLEPVEAGSNYDIMVNAPPAEHQEKQYPHSLGRKVGSPMRKHCGRT